MYKKAGSVADKVHDNMDTQPLFKRSEELMVRLRSEIKKKSEIP